jgi:uncharacterized membrane protein YagU involved in acid resistance
VLGAIYGGLAELAPAVTAGYGAAYGTAVNLVLDEAIVPALGLGPSPFKTPLKTTPTAPPPTPSSVLSWRSAAA